MPRLRRLIPGSLVQYTDHLGNVTEMHHVVCNHCQKGTDVPSLRVLQNHVDVCRTCFKFICDACANDMVHGKLCVPWEKRCEEYEKIYEQAVKEYGKELGQ